jgi:hypothetical protein
VFGSIPGCARLAGRTEAAPVIYEAKYPVLLLPKDPVTEVLARFLHRKLMHSGGSRALLTELSKFYWVQRVTTLLHLVAYKCVICRRKFAKPTHQMMAPLPFFRLPTARFHTFDHSAIEVAGPYNVIKDKMEGEEVDDKLPGKRWVLVIRCATVGAVHLEMIDTMDTASFLLAIEQFLVVRPRTTVFLADNGTNFHGGDNILREKKVTKKDMKNKRPIDLSEAQRKLNIEFRFAPPRAHHFQGLVERVVGVAKATLRPALRTALVSSKELRTILAKTMGIINNFPIAYTIRSDRDFHYRLLTPNHFLMGQPYAEAELQAEDTTKITALKRYKKVQQVLCIFWAKLIAELTPHLRQYKTGLQKRGESRKGTYYYSSTQRREECYR